MKSLEFAFDDNWPLAEEGFKNQANLASFGPMSHSVRSVL